MNNSKTIFKEKTKAMEEKFNSLLDQSHNVLFTTKSIFPFDFFPDSLIIDINQIHITTREFFKSQKLYSMSIQDIREVFVETSPWFATLKIVGKDFNGKSVKISFLKRDDALKAKKIIQGLSIGVKEGVDFSQIQKDSLSEKLEDLGSPSNHETPI